MKIVNIIGSPRKGGNTDFAVSYIMSKVQDRVKGAQVELIDLRHLEIKPCIGCRKCMTSNRCFIEGDDLEIVLKQLLNADIIIEAAPVFWNSPPGIMKNFIDRAHAIYGIRSQAPMKGKKAFIVSVAADSGFYTHEDIMSCWLEAYGAQIEGKVRLLAREAGDLEANQREMKKLQIFVDKIETIARAMSHNTAKS